MLVAVVISLSAIPSRAAAVDEWVMLERQLSAPWPTLQRPDGSFGDYVLDSRPPVGVRGLYGTAAMGLALLQAGVRGGDEVAIGSGFRALSHALAHIAVGRRAVFQNLALAATYDFARHRLRSDPRFAALRPALKDRLRHMRLELLGGDRPYYNYYLVEALLVLELRRCGLTSGVRGSLLGHLPAAVREAKLVVSRQVRAAVGRYVRRDASRGRTAIISDPPWNPLAYHAFSLALLAQAIELLGPQAPAPARALLVDGARASAALIAPDGDVSYFGRSQEQAWALPMTAYGAEVAAVQPGVSPVLARRLRTLSLRVLARLRDLYAGGPYGLFITPALGEDLRGGIAGLDAYAAAVTYSATTLIWLDRTIERLGASDVRPLPLTSDRAGASVLARGASAFAVVRTANAWYVVKQGPGQRVAGAPDFSRDLRYDFGLIALEARGADGAWRDVLRLRPHVRGWDAAGPNLLRGRAVYRPYGRRLRATQGGGTRVDVGFRDGPQRALRYATIIRYQPVRCGVRTIVATRHGDRVEYSVFLKAASAASDLTRHRILDAAQEVTFDQAARITIDRRHYSSGRDADLVRARIHFAPSTGEPIVITITGRAC
jgi:hypothetical protein